MACITSRRGRLIIDFYDQHGKRRIKTLPKGTTKTRARQELREIEEQVERGTYLPRAVVPSFSDVADNWLDYKKPHIRESTHEQYEGHIENHLKPYFGLTKIGRINFHAIEKYMAHAARNDVSGPMLRKLLVTLGGILRYAVQKRLIESNPVSQMQKPKATGKGKVDFLRPHEIRALIGNANGQEFKTLYTLAVMSGMRQGEILGLKWGDIDWLNSQVHVRRTYNHYRFYEPKSETSRRAIDLGETVIRELKRWKVQALPNELDLVFPSKAGTPMDCNRRFKIEFQAALRRAKLRRIRFHDLRHTYAALMIDQDENIKYIQAQMGHSSINVTMDTYGHLMKSVNREAPKRLDRVVFRGSGDILVTKTEKGLSDNL